MKRKSIDPLVLYHDPTLLMFYIG